MVCTPDPLGSRHSVVSVISADPARHSCVPDQKLRAGSQDLADIHDANALTSMTPAGRQKNFGQKDFGLIFRFLRFRHTPKFPLSKTSRVFCLIEEVQPSGAGEWGGIQLDVVMGAPLHELVIENALLVTAFSAPAL